MTKIEILRSLAHNLPKLLKVLVPNAATVKSPLFHKELSDSITDDSIRLQNIIAPRGTAKSTIAAVAQTINHLFVTPALLRLLGKKPRPRVVVIISKTQGHAKNILDTIKHVIETSANFKLLFGDWSQQTARKWREDYVVFKDASAIICKGMGQQVRGLNINNQRPTLAIVDDPEDELNTKTSESMENNLNWLLKALEPTLDKHIGRCIVIGTPVHERCLVFSLSKMSEWKTLHYSYIVEENGERRSLWPEMMSLDMLDKKLQDMTVIGKSSVFYSEYMCQVIGDGDRIFREEYFQYYEGYIKESTWDYSILHLSKINGEPVDGEKGKDVYIYNFQGVDPASSVSQSADYSVVMSVGIDADSNLYVLPYFRRRVTPMALGDSIIDKIKNEKPRRIKIESIQFQEMLREYVYSRLQAENLIVPGLSLKVMPRTSKSLRLESLEPLFARKKVFIQPYMTDLKAEFLSYPKSLHDDIMDSFHIAVTGIYPPDPSEAKVYEERKNPNYKTAANNLGTDSWYLS
jgi:predicted phage terminase large subunit-like protein